MPPGFLLLRAMDFSSASAAAAAAAAAATAAPCPRLQFECQAQHCPHSQPPLYDPTSNAAYHHQYQYDTSSAYHAQCPDHHYFDYHLQQPPLVFSHQDATFLAPQSVASSDHVPPGLTPAAAAAVAALSQLTQFAGSMDAAEKARAGVQQRQQDRYWQGMSGGDHRHQHQLGQVLVVQHAAPHAGLGIERHRGSGRRGCVALRVDGGGSKGSSTHHSTKPAGGRLFGGRGRGGHVGTVGGKEQKQPATGQQFPYTASAAASTLTKDPTNAQKTSTAPAPSRQHSLLPVAWCDICRVDCNSLAILEQHKNGKRHKKTVKMIEAREKLLAEMEALGTPDKNEQVHGQAKTLIEPPNNIGQPEIAVRTAGETQGIIGEGGTQNATLNEKSNKSASERHRQAYVKVETLVESQNNETAQSEIAVQKVGENQTIQVESATHNENSEIDQQTKEPDKQSEGNANPCFPVKESASSSKRPLKRKMKISSVGGENPRYHDQPIKKKHVKKPPPIPQICDVCNIKCDTVAVFESHLAGKKHIAKLKHLKSQATFHELAASGVTSSHPSAYNSHGSPAFYGNDASAMAAQAAYGCHHYPMKAYQQQQAGAHHQVSYAYKPEQYEAPVGQVFVQTHGLPGAPL